MLRFLQYLRIAFSATCLIACVLLIALWVRSYWWWDTTSAVPKHSLASVRGRLLWDTPLEAIARPGSPDLTNYAKPHFGTYSYPLEAIIIMPGRGGMAM